MKKLLIVLFSIFILISCSKSPEKQAKENVEKYIKAKLDDPKSYESVNFGKLDSTFSLFDESKEGIELQQQDEKYSQRMSELSAEIDIADNISELDKIIEETKIISQKRKDLTDTIFSRSIAYSGKFCGYKIKHSFRAKNKMGALVLDSCIVELDTLMNVKLIR